jgi:hypothetical protein
MTDSFYRRSSRNSLVFAKAPIVAIGAPDTAIFQAVFTSVLDEYSAHLEGAEGFRSTRGACRP